MSLKAINAAENSRAANKYVHNYVGVDGRCYKTESGDARKLKPRKSAIKNGIANDRVSATDVARVEYFLSTGDAVKARKMSISQAERERVAREYALAKSGGEGRWMGDEEAIFSLLGERFVAAYEYKSFKDIKYAMKYGDTRNGEIKVIKVGADK